MRSLGEILMGVAEDIAAGLQVRRQLVQPQRPGQEVLGALGGDELITRIERNLNGYAVDNVIPASNLRREYSQ